VANSLNAAYGHGYRVGQIGMARIILPATFPRQVFFSMWVKEQCAPEWLPTALQRFVWRQGLCDGAGVTSLFSILRILGA
jgi:hypothetical protein